jgi:hypothetical protein
MSGKQRPAHCSPNSQSSPAVVCPLDGGVSRHGGPSLRKQHSVGNPTAPSGRSRATSAATAAAGMGRMTDASRGQRTNAAQALRTRRARANHQARALANARVLRYAERCARARVALLPPALRCAGRQRTDSPARPWRSARRTCPTVRGPPKDGPPRLHVAIACCAQALRCETSSAPPLNSALRMRLTLAHDG